jgi:hypothetical protein
LGSYDAHRKGFPAPEGSPITERFLGFPNRIILINHVNKIPEPDSVMVELGAANEVACSPDSAKCFLKSLFNKEHADKRDCLDAIYRDTKVKMVDISMSGPNGTSVRLVNTEYIMAIDDIKPPGF